jgi:aryl-alcohol dehydrogenase-like predicted oxidoreductase
MENSTLGKDGLFVKPLCIGTWAWGDKLFWNYGDGYGEAELEEAFTAAIAAGVTCFDTAEVYGLGLSEKLLGQFRLKTQQNIQIATKFGPLPWRFTGESVSTALTDSLNRLQVDKVELYQVHWPFTFLISQETLMNTLANEVERGRIGAIGVSNYSAKQMREAHEILAKRGLPLATNQVRYSLLSRQIESQGILSTARDLGITILAYSPLAQGLLTGKYTGDQPPVGLRSLDPKFSRDGLRKIAPITSLLSKIGEVHQKSIAQVALNWLIAQENVVPIAGVKNAAQVNHNVGALGWKLTDIEVHELDQASRDYL